MNIYVSGKFAHREHVIEIVDLLTVSGHHVNTFDWSVHVSNTFKKRETGVINNMEDIKLCDILIAVMPNPDSIYKGTWVEIGAALALDKKVVILGRDIKSIYIAHPNISMYNLKDMNEAFSELDIILEEK